MNLTKATLKGSDIASASTITPAGAYDRFDVTGTVTITTINTDGRGIGARFWLRLSGVLQITHDGTKLKLTGAANFTSAAGDAILFEVIGTNQVQELVRVAAVDAARIGSGAVSNAEFSYLDGVTSAIQTQLDAKVAKTSFPCEIGIAIGDEVTALATGTAVVTLRMPYAMTLTAVRANLNTVSSSGTPTFDIKEGGTTILSTKITIDASEKTSVTAATPAVISDSALADDAEITINVDVAGTGAKGAKIWLIGTRSV